MAVITVTYERLYNLGNYENERLTATATVEHDAAAAFDEARAAVQTQHEILQTERADEARRRREEYEARERAQRAEWEAERQARLAAVAPEADEGSAF